MCQSGERADVGLSESLLAPRTTGAITLYPPFFLCCPAPLRLGVAEPEGGRRMAANFLGARFPFRASLGFVRID